MNKFWQDRALRKRRYQRMKARAEACEGRHPTGEVGRIVQQMRFRAVSARQQAKVFLVSLLLVTVVAIGVFVIAPYVVDFYNGQRQTLVANAEALAAEQAGIPAESREIVTRVEQTFVGRTAQIETGMSDSILWRDVLRLPDNRALLYGDEGAAALFDPAVPGKLQPLETPDGWSFRDAHLLDDGTALLLADEGFVFVYRDETRVLDAVPFDGATQDATNFFGVQESILVDDGTAVLRAGGSIFRLDPASQSVSEVTLPPTAAIVVPSALLALRGGGFLVAGDSARLAVFPADPDGTPTSIPIEFLSAASPQVHALAAFPDGVSGFDGGSRVLVSGPGGEIALVALSGEIDAQSRVNDPSDGGVFRRVVQTEDARQTVFLGDAGKYFAIDLRNGFLFEELSVPGKGEVRLNGATWVEDKSLFIFADNDTVLWIKDIEQAPFISVIDLGTGEPVSGDGALLFPTAGSSSVYWQSSISFGNGAHLILGDEGHVLEVDLSDDQSAWGEDHQVRDARIEALREVQDSPADILALLQGADFLGQAEAELRDITRELGELEGRRKLLERQVKGAGDDLEDFNSWLLEQEQIQFADFIRVCREGAGPVQAGDAGVPDAVHLACLDAWARELDGRERTVFESLARQVPPGVLLLFLLATLSALYRYNLRLAGFHSSRADVVELVSKDGGTDLETVTALSNALAADKVEFGRARTPSDQVIDLISGLNGKGRAGGG